MSAEEPDSPAGAPPAPAGDDKASAGDSPDSAAGSEEQPDRPQDAWSARRDLVDHSPQSFDIGAHVRIDGSLVAGDQTGVSHGTARDVFMGGQTVNHYVGVSAASHAAGEVPPATLVRTDDTFVTTGTAFGTLMKRLDDERVVPVSGGRFTGRRTAAFVALYRMGVSPVRLLTRDTRPEDLAARLENDQDHDGNGDGPRGYVLCDLTTRRDQPLQEAHLLAVREQLARHKAYLVITVDPSAVLEDIEPLLWRPPAPADVLARHLRALADEAVVEGLLVRPEVVEFLDRGHQLRELVAFAALLSRYAAGKADERALSGFSQSALESQIQEWFEAEEAVVPLRDKAFLISLAVFDDGPYALTAELSDLLYAFLQETRRTGLRPEVPVFGTHIGKRLLLARAREYVTDEKTEWGPVPQSKAAFLDGRTWRTLLSIVWTRHPSARPALIKWLGRLALDGRPLVRTRAASAAAVLAQTDLPSAMALVIEPWAGSRMFRDRLAAVNALVLAHLISAPNIPSILDAWCKAGRDALRWVAIRTYGLIGDEHPEQALAALRGALRTQYEADAGNVLMVAQIAQSVELLLLSPARERVLVDLAGKRETDRAAQDLALYGFLGACRHRQDDKPYGIPHVLAWYARSADADGGAAERIAGLWRAALGDRRHTDRALATLGDWVRTADRDPAAEWALAALLPHLVTTATEHERLGHLLRTQRGDDGAPPPPVSGRLLTVLPHPRTGTGDRP